ncbi:MAG: hypothetical protein R3E58_18065 [Phycisphaerae bacterium]|nr:hypothetical protein [Phycisphaerales bacterium]
MKAENNESVLDKQMDDICEGLRLAIDNEVDTLRREGMPIYVAQNGNIVDLQSTESNKSE